ncbi:DUF2474 family protein [Ferrovibrio xuzhouensis]|uniref:DUF2474 family protein n=1 Tax=Ferrovibrio xuzhouensis TaxID=1576914 RepID=A0ABV7VGG5_9PROT
MPAITDQAQVGRRPPPLWRRLLWFAALWAGGVFAVGVVGLAIRLVLKP